MAPPCATGPHPPAALEAKYRGLAEPLWGPARAARLREAILDAQRCPGVSEPLAQPDPPPPGVGEALLRTLAENIPAMVVCFDRDARRDPLDVSEMARTVWELLAAAEPGRRVAFDLVPGLTAHDDPALVRNVLENLLGNAFNCTRHASDARVAFGAAFVGDETVFHVRDDGTGFDMAHAARLFGACERLHAHNEFAGSGIGLATARRIVQRHGGRIWAEAAPERGATFYFTLAPPA
jgi:light-regulated signal transduction histidine kinase (bacteriophytochrome)